MSLRTGLSSRDLLAGDGVKLLVVVVAKGVTVDEGIVVAGSAIVDESSTRCKFLTSDWQIVVLDAAISVLKLRFLI